MLNVRTVTSEDRSKPPDGSSNPFPGNGRRLGGSPTAMETDKSAANNYSNNEGDENTVSQEGRLNRSSNKGNRNKVSQNSKEYDPTILKAGIVLLVGIFGWIAVNTLRSE